MENSNTDVMNSRNPQLRLFTVKRSSSFTPKTDVVGTWQEAVPATVREFSATAYYFGRMIQQQLNIPVGLIVASWEVLPVKPGCIGLVEGISRSKDSPIGS